jgi:hypothetical protein
VNEDVMPIGPAAFDEVETIDAWRRHFRFASIALGIAATSAVIFVVLGGFRRDISIVVVSVGVTSFVFAVQLLSKCWTLRRFLKRSSWTLREVDLELLNRKLLGMDKTVSRLSFSTPEGQVIIETMPGDGTVNARKIVRPAGGSNPAGVTYEVRVAGPVGNIWVLSDPGGRKLFRARVSTSMGSTPVSKLAFKGVPGSVGDYRGFD